MKNFFKEIAIAEKKTELLFKENKVKVNISEITKFDKSHNNSLLKSGYITSRNIYLYK